MELPKDSAPTREQMIDTYLNSLATVLGSMEEAKKNMYAFSNATYTGFQCTVYEAMSEKFKGLPGVLWVLPDSYVEVKNKDYGGDKYTTERLFHAHTLHIILSSEITQSTRVRRYERRKDGPPRRSGQQRQGAPAPRSTSD